MSSSPQRRCDVLVVGAGPAGIAAAATAAECGRNVLLIDDNFHPGGQIWRAASSGGNSTTSRVSEKWLRRLENIAILRETRIIAQCGRHRVVAEGPEESCEIQYESIVLATGARERFLPFPGWTLPNVTGAGGLQAMVSAGLSVAGKRVVVAGSGPLLLAAAAFLRNYGARIEMTCEQSSRSKMAAFSLALLARPEILLQAARYRLQLLPSPYRFGWWPIAAGGTGKLETVTLTNGKKRKEIACDYLACGFHLVANLELPALFGCRIDNGCVVVDAYQRTSVPETFCAGEAAGIGGLQLALITGRIAGLASAGRNREAARLFRIRRSLSRFSARMAAAFQLRPELKILPLPTLVCRCEDVSLGALKDYDSWRPARIHTRCGMGPCQGRVCGPAVEFIFNWETGSVRPPVYPARLSTLARVSPQPGTEPGGE